MDIVRAGKMGFCFGVNGAIDSCIEEIPNIKKGRNVFILGMLVHNQYVVDAIERKGLKTITEESLFNEKLQLKEGDLVIIRAHGTTKEVYERLMELKVEVKDATCVFVKKIREKIKEYHIKKQGVIFIGDKEHPEVVGVLSFGDDVLVFSSLEELKERNDEIEKNKKYYVLTQTTLNKIKLAEIKKYLENNHSNVTIDTKICSATQERQEAVLKLARDVDFVLIVGGKNSSNTKKLYEISKKINERTKLIENEEELDKEWFHGIKRVGVTAGASTPEELIKKIENKLRGL